MVATKLSMSEVGGNQRGGGRRSDSAPLNRLRVVSDVKEETHASRISCCEFWQEPLRWEPQ